MARVRIAGIIGVVAVAGSLAACGGSTAKPTAAAVTVTSTVQATSTAPSSAPSTAQPSTQPSTQSSTTAEPSSQPSTEPSAKSSTTAGDGGGVANAGDQVTIVGTLQYLAPGKFLVHPDDGSTDQGFYVSDSTQILGAAVICGDPDGNVSIGGDGYGTRKCTESDLETAAKKNYVKVRITMDRKSGSVSTVEEKYHP